MDYKIYFDMDGVLADFERGVRELCGVIPPDQDEAFVSGSDEEMWAGIRSIPHFFDRLEPMPGAKSLFDRLYAQHGDHVEILTGIPKPKRNIPTAGEDKTKWVHRLLSEDVKVNIVLRAEKPQYVRGRSDYLIDDMAKNIAEWEAAGGTGIRYQDAKNTVQKLIELGLLPKASDMVEIDQA